MSVSSRPERRLIVTADDFGASPAVNRGVIRAHEDGIVTSASLMVHGRAAAAAAALARTHPTLSVGLHIDVAEWEYGDRGWVATYERVPPDDIEAMREEVHDQLARFESLVGHPPTHLDSHQHAHRTEPLRTLLTGIARERRAPLRDETSAAAYCGGFYGQSARGESFPDGITLTRLVGIFDELTDAITELGCHPADAADLETAYAKERIAELGVLCDPRVRQALADRGIVLTSFADLELV